MRPLSLLILIGWTLSLAGCNGLTTAQIANVSCVGAEAGAELAVVVASDVNAGGNATKAAGRAQQTASIVQKTVGDACPILVGGVSALSAAAK